MVAVEAIMAVAFMAVAFMAVVGMAVAGTMAITVVDGVVAAGVGEVQ
jgi:hypothetical protein